jgi:hypothetical protein
LVEKMRKRATTSAAQEMQRLHLPEDARDDIADVLRECYRREDFEAGSSDSLHLQARESAAVRLWAVQQKVAGKLGPVGNWPTGFFALRRKPSGGQRNKQQEAATFAEQTELCNLRDRLFVQKLVGRKNKCVRTRPSPRAMRLCHWIPDPGRCDFG